jgi:hypothetical protein
MVDAAFCTEQRSVDMSGARRRNSGVAAWYGQAMYGVVVIVSVYFEYIIALLIAVKIRCGGGVCCSGEGRAAKGNPDRALGGDARIGS